MKKLIVTLLVLILTQFQVSKVFAASDGKLEITKKNRFASTISQLSKILLLRKFLPHHPHRQEPVGLDNHLSWYCSSV